MQVTDGTKHRIENKEETKCLCSGVTRLKEKDICCC